MEKTGKVYEPPMVKIYRFDDDSDLILTASGSGGEGGETPVPDYAANALNKLMGGTNTTIE